MKLKINRYLTDLSLRAIITAPNGLRFDGYIFGLKNIYCVAIFFDNQVLYLNKNLFSNCVEAITKINNSLKTHFTIKSYFPLKYEITLDIEKFNKNFSGEFDIIKKRIDEERLESDGLGN